VLAASFLDYLDVLIWPIVVAGFLAFSLYRYGEYIGPLINRISHVERPNGKFPLGLGVELAEQPQLPLDVP